MAVYIGLGALLLVSMAVRLYQLGSGLWFDEIMTLKEYARLPYLEIVTRFKSENQHFLYSLLAHSSILLFGESAWSLRLPAVLFGVGSIWAVYMLGAEVTDRKQAFLASALLAFSYHHLWFSQNARGYTGLLFWTSYQAGCCSGHSANLTGEIGYCMLSPVLWACTHTSPWDL